MLISTSIRAIKICEKDNALFPHVLQNRFYFLNFLWQCSLHVSILHAQKSHRCKEMCDSSLHSEQAPRMGVFQREYPIHNPNTRSCTWRTLPHTASVRRSQGMRPSGAHQRHYLKALI